MVKRNNIKTNCALLNTRDVLVEHLEAKLKLLNPSLPPEVVGIVGQSSNDEILQLLQDPMKLNAKLSAVAKHCIEEENRELIGEQLFLKVAEVDSELCAQVTGMLLELETSSVKTLLSDTEKLKEAVFQAKSEYLKYSLGVDKYLEKIGEKLFIITSAYYPAHASQITGMLLELESSELCCLLRNRQELEEKIKHAYSALVHQK